MKSRDTTRAVAGNRLARQRRMADELRRWGWVCEEPEGGIDALAERIRAAVAAEAA